MSLEEISWSDILLELANLLKAFVISETLKQEGDRVKIYGDRPT